MAKAGGLEVIAGAMRGWREYPMVQLCALLCMVPLALDNTVLQVRTVQPDRHIQYLRCLLQKPVLARSGA